MVVPPRVIQCVEEHFKRPRVDPEWLHDCYHWLTTEGEKDVHKDFEGLIAAVVHQVLASDFSDSMQAGTGFPTDVAHVTTKTTVDSILVEVTAVVNLNDTRKSERLENGNAGKGGGPSSQRGVLQLYLSDGAITLLALARRPLPELSLENTRSGYKVVLIYGSIIDCSHVGYS
ncbi:hypothetical protein FPV67DRAFT_1414468 [Lyophyllum atratum]|nr:hypothetical protein FPV67DRAFT_1414468 [Lyophyllum atratum]